MAINDTYELSLTAIHTSGQTCENVWHYLVTDQPSGVSDAVDLADGFESGVVSNLVGLTNDSWVYANINIVNLDEPQDWADVPVAEAGTVTGNSLPPVLRVGFRSPKQDTGVNRAAKRFALGAITNIDGDGELNTAFISNCAFLAQVLGSDLIQSGVVYTPVTIRKHYANGSFVGYDVRAVVTGVWQINRSYTTQKSAQNLDWVVPL